MIYSTATVPVNPAGEVPLTRAQAWAGLVLKARDARAFLPPNLCTRCEVVEESETHIVRDATIAGQDLREIICFEAESKVTFFQATGPREGAIVNELFEDASGQLQRKRLAGPPCATGPVQLSRATRPASSDAVAARRCARSGT